ncbi:MAG TPA: TetR/AcrR family transcriptional regulator [Polyangiales bacterium]
MRLRLLTHAGDIRFCPLPSPVRHSGWRTPMPRASKAKKIQRRTPKTARSRATVEAILQGTARTLVKRGYADATSNHIAEEAGVGIGSFYEYFEDKNDAVVAVVNQFAARAFDHAAKTVAVALQKPHRDAVRYFIGEMVEFTAAESSLIRTLYQQVPFVWEMPRVQKLVTQLEQFGLALAKQPGFEATAQAKLNDKFYVIGIAVGATIVQIATDPAKEWRRARLADELSLMITRYLRLQ